MKKALEVKSRLGKVISVTEKRWNLIVEVKHPDIRGKMSEVKKTIRNPGEIRKSTRDPNVYLYYRQLNDTFICVVCKHENQTGFIVTAYVTDRVKIGENVWRK